MLNNQSTLNAGTTGDTRKTILSVQGIRHGYDKSHSEDVILFP